jgi:NADH-quinone oxidoreductase subunit L
VIHGVEHGFHHAHGDGHGDHHGSHVIHRADGDLDPNDPQDMRNMGGLLKRMPLTGWTFVIGGLALSGFPFISAGFWSKDEILSSTWYTEDTLIFWMLAISAFLTAFYTARQIVLTFLGKPRSEGAAQAPESVRSMTFPLLLIAPFAVALGWLGIPASFPGIGGVVPNFIEHLMEPYIEYMGIHVAHPEFNFFVLLISLVVALGGLAAGYFVYRKGLPDGEIDPMRRWLGPLWWAMHRKFWVDEFYDYTIVPLTRGMAKFAYWVDDLWIIDPIINAIGRIGVAIAKFCGEFDRYVVDGVVNLTGKVSMSLGAVLRNAQNGQVQVYLMVVAVTLMIWLLLTALPALLTLV